MNRRAIQLSLIFVILLLIDQATKLYVLDLFQQSGSNTIEVNKFFNLVLVWNYGVSFGTLNNPMQSQGLLIIIALAIIIGLVTWVSRTKEKEAEFPAALIISGAIGNILDRLLHGAVVDFIDLHYDLYHYPAFNIADSCIVIGALLLAIQSIKAVK
jgi:signal peptidase II